MSIETFHISSTHNKQQVGIKSVCTEERGKSYDSNKCVQISEVSGTVPPFKVTVIRNLMNINVSNTRCWQSIPGDFNCRLDGGDNRNILCDVMQNQWHRHYE